MSHLNTAAIAELKDIMEDGFGDLVEAFIMDTEDKLLALQSAIEAGDAAKVGEIGHSLKGASSNICAEALAAIYKQIEDAGREGTIDGVPEVLAKATEEYIAVKEELSAI